MFLKQWLVFSLMVLVCAGSSILWAEAPYTFIPIPKPVGNTELGVACGVNESGVVVVAIAPAPGPKSVSYTWDIQNGIIPVNCGYETVGSGINDQGQVVARAMPEYPQWDAHIWKDGVDNNIGQVPGYNQALPNAINCQGVIVGWCASGPYTPFHAMIGDATTGLQLLPGVGDQEHANSYANDINCQNQVVGYWKDNELETAYVWEHVGGKNVVTSLSNRDGAASSRARGINDLGVIVGMSGSHAVIWNASTITDMGTLGGTLAEAYTINHHGIAVGYSHLADGSKHAFVWKNNQMYDLNTLTTLPSGWVLNYAYDINNSGMIVGEGTFNGEICPFALTIPEPATMGFLLLGGLAMARRKRR
jgi:probable HAF family extracellular repeat protein